MTYTIEDIAKAVAYNQSHELYSDDPEYVRVYFCYVGGKYHNQMDRVNSVYQLERLREHLKIDGHGITDIEIITTSDAWQDYVQSWKGAH